MSETVCGLSSTDLQVTQSKLTFRCPTVTSIRNEPKHRRIWSCDEWTDSALQFLQQSLNGGNSLTDEQLISADETNVYVKSWDDED